MTLAELDSELAEWRDRQGLIEANLDSFAALPAYRRLADAPALQGETAARVAAAAEVLSELRRQQTILAETLDRARERRHSVSRLKPSRPILAEIEQALLGPSIELGCYPTPPERRELLRGVDQTVRVTPARLMEIMLESFRSVRDTVLAVAAVQDRITAALDGWRSELDPLRPLAAAHGGEPLALFQSASDSVAELGDLARADPVAAESRMVPAMEQVQTAAAAVDAIDRKHRDAVAALAAAGRLLGELRETHDRAKTAVAECLLKVDGDPPASMSDESALPSLEAWLAKLRGTVERGEHGPAMIGLGKWTRTAADALATDQSAAETAGSAVRARRDLRGLFEALQAKAAGQSRDHDRPLSDLASEIRQLLAQRPTPLERAKSLVSRYEQQLI
jgi:hypothetical protein